MTDENPLFILAEMADSALASDNAPAPSRGRSRSARTAVQAGLILLSSAAIGLAFNTVNRSGIPLITPEEVSVSEYVNWSLYLEDMRVTLEEARTAFDGGEAVFIDARSARAYEAGHIPGAHRLSSREVGNRGADDRPN